MLGKVLIIGFGFLGQVLGDLLIEQGYEVYSIKRQTQNVSASYHPIALDVTKPFDKSINFPKFDYVIYMVSAGEYSPEAYQKAYVEGVKNTVDFLQSEQPQVKRLIYVSSTSVFEESLGNWVDEHSPISTSSFSAKALIEGEEMVSSASLPTTVLRLSGIYGPNRLSRFQSMIDAVQNETPILQGEDSFTNRIHVEDAARAIQHVMQLPHSDELYIVSDTEPMKKNDIAMWLANDLNKPLCTDKKGEARHQHGKSKRCSSQKLVNSGFQFKYPTLSEFYYKNKTEFLPSS